MKKKILAIDDSKAIRFLLRTVFNRNYYIVTAADAGSAMFWLTKRNLPDLIIVDPQLPDIKNWELIEYLAASGMYGSIPLMVLSALDKVETQDKCKDLGVEQFFLKPFNPLELVKSVDRFTSVGKKMRESQYN